MSPGNALHIAQERASCALRIACWFAAAGSSSILAAGRAVVSRASPRQSPARARARVPTRRVPAGTMWALLESESFDLSSRSGFHPSQRRGVLAPPSDAHEQHLGRRVESVVETVGSR